MRSSLQRKDLVVDLDRSSKRLSLSPNALRRVSVVVMWPGRTSGPKGVVSRWRGSKIPNFQGRRKELRGRDTHHRERTPTREVLWNLRRKVRESRRYVLIVKKYTLREVILLDSLKSKDWPGTDLVSTSWILNLSNKSINWKNSKVLIEHYDHQI